MKALNGQGNLKTRVKALTANIHDPLLRVVKRLQRELKPGKAAPLISGFRPILQLVVFGYENGVPTIDTVDFALKEQWLRSHYHQSNHEHLVPEMGALS